MIELSHYQQQFFYIPDMNTHSKSSSILRDVSRETYEAKINNCTELIFHPKKSNPLFDETFKKTLS